MVGQFSPHSPGTTVATLTRNLKLRLSEDLSGDARYNLERIDQLGSTFNINTNNNTIVRAPGDIQFRPQDNSVGGDGVGGTVQLGDITQPLDSAIINGPLKLLANSKYLTLSHTNSVSDVSLTIDTDEANRLLSLGGNLSISGGDISFIAAGNQTVNLPITNAEVAASAGIVDTKLATISTAGKVANSATTATDANTPSSIVARDASGNFLAGTITANLLGSSSTFTGNLTGDITSVGMSTAIAPGVIVDGDVNAAAAIAGSKVSPIFGNQLVSTEQGFDINGGTYTTSIRPATSQASNVTLRLPSDNGTSNAVLTTDGAGNTSWSALIGSGTVTSVGLSMPGIFTVVNSPVVSSGTLAVTLNTQPANRVFAGPASGPDTNPSFRQLSSDELVAGSTNKFYTSTLFNNDLATKTTTNLAEGTNLYHTSLRAQDAVGAIILDTATADLSYVAGTSLSVNVLPAGFINSSSGLSSSANILRVDPTVATSKASPVSNDVLLIADSEDSNSLKKVTLSSIVGVSGGSYASNWTSGLSITLTHNLNTWDVLIEVYDNVTYETVQVDVVRDTTNAVTLTASEAPTGAGLRVLIKKI